MALGELGFQVDWPELLMLGWDWNTRAEFIQHFYAYCYSERGLAAGSLDSCSSGIKRILRENGGDVAAFDDVRCKQVRAGAHRLDSLYRRTDQKKLPVSGGMVRTMVQQLLTKGGRSNWLTAMAALLGYFSALRVCEYIQRDSSVEGHVITTDDVRFLFQKPSRWLPAWQVTARMVQMAEGLQITLRSAKNDQRAEGSSWSFYRDMEEAGEPFVELMAQWASLALSRAGDPFLSFRNKDSRETLTVLKYRSFNVAIKAMAESCGFHPGDFGTHSLRIGALTQLAAAGVALEVAQRTARHKCSQTTEKYQKESKAERRTVIGALSNTRIFGEDDIRALTSRTRFSHAAAAVKEK
jgi:hypothetical protein